MKTKIKRHYRSVVSVLLSVCMLVSCMTVGLIATDAARVSGEESVGVSGTVYIEGDFGWSWVEMYQKDGNYYYSLDTLSNGCQWKFKYNNSEYGSTSTDESTRKIYNYGESNGKTVKSNSTSTFRNNIGSITTGVTIWLSGDLTKTWITAGKTANPIDVTVSSVDNAVVSATQGSVTVNEGDTGKKFQKGSDATVTITPDAGYIPETLTVGSNAYTLSDLTKSGSNYTYTFTVPETATGTFTISAVMKRQIAKSASISANPPTLSAEGASARVTVTPTTPATNNLKYTLYDDADNSVVDTVTVTDGSAAEFTVTPTAKYTSYYAVLEENPNSGTYSTLTTDKVLITNPALREKYTVTFAANDPSKGTVTAVTDGGTTLTSGDKVFENTVVTFTAIPKTKCLFKKWEDNSTTTPRDVTITGDTTVTGSFSYSGYELLYNDTTIKMKELDDGTFVSTSKVGYFSGNTLDTSKRFTIKNLSNDKVAYADSSDTYWINDLNKKASVASWATNTDAAKKIAKTWVNHSGQSAYVGFDPYTEKVWLSDNPQLARDVKIIAKNGTIRYDYDDRSHTNKIADGNPTRKFGTTTITKKSGTVAGSVTDAYSNNAKELSITGPENGNGVTLTITTSSVKSGYYVKGWVVNGETYLCKDSSGNPITGTTSDGNYSFDYVVDKFPDTVNGRIEITPVYYSTRANYVGFYVTGYEMAKSDWGNTLAIYSYKGSDPLDGDWPGQPMLKINGRYYAQIADDATGITLSNYVFDYVHNRTDKTMNLADNSTDKDKTIHQYQTYDFNDFKRIQNYKLAGQSDPEIIFSFKYKKGAWWNATNNDVDNFYKFSGMINYNNGDPSYPNNPNINDFKGPWEDLTNYYGKKVDIFETELTNAQLSNSAYYVVSNGYIKNEVGEYATDWIIYENNNGSLTKKYRFCSESVRLKATFNDSGQVTGDFESLRYLQGHPIKITYEFSNLSGYHDGARSSNYVDTTSGSNNYHGQPSYRGDGRWTYTEKRKVKAHVIIEYADHARSTFTRDYFQPDNYDFTSGTNYDPEPHTGRTTGTQAYFTDTSNPEKQTESEKWTKSNQSFNFKAEPDPDHEYTFIGWYLLDDGTYSLLDFNEDGTCSVKVDNNDVFVARFIKTPAGNVKLSHELMDNSKNPDLGATFNSAEIVDSDNKTVKAITGNPIATNNEGTTLIKSKYIKADYAAAGYKLKITLKTTPKTSPSAEFKSFYYDINKSDTQTKITGTGSLGGTAVNVDNIDTSSTDKTATIYVPLSYFFEIQDDEYFFDISKDTLKFYSELEISSRNFTVTKTLAEYTETDPFTILIETKTGDGDWTPYARQGYSSEIGGTAGAGGTTNENGEAEIHQNETLTFEDIAMGTYVRVTEVGTVKDYIFDSAAAVKHTSSTDVKTDEINGCSFQITDDDVDVTINNKRQEYTWIIKSTYNSRLWSTQGYQAEGTFTKDQLDTYTTYTEVTDYATGNTVHGIKFKSPEDRAAFVANYLPHEDNFRQEVTLNPGSSSENYYAADKQISMGLTASYDDAERLTVQYKFPCEMKHTSTGSVATNKDANGHAIVDGSSATTLTINKNVLYMNWYCLNNVILSNGVPNGDPVFVSAPESIIENGTVKYFHHWSVQTADGSVEYTRCYNREYNYAFYQDSIVTPVYVEADQPFDHTAVSEEERSENPATITFLEASRNQWNNTQCGEAKNVWNADGLYSDYGDRIFVDFVLDLHYIENGINLQLNTIPEAGRSKYHAGLLIQKLDELDKYTEGEHKGEYITDNAHYAEKYASTDGKTAAMTALTGGTATKANSYYNSVISVADFDNKNELEYYYNFANISQSAAYRTRTAYKNYAFRAYTYLYVDGGQQIISAPVYFTMYDIASIENLYDIAQTNS